MITLSIRGIKRHELGTEKKILKAAGYSFRSFTRRRCKGTSPFGLIRHPYTSLTNAMRETESS